MFEAVRSVLGIDKPTKMQPFNEILNSRSGSTHQTGLIVETDEYRWERVRIQSIDSFTYDSYQNRPLSLTTIVQTMDGMKEFPLMSCELHYIAPYVPAKSVDDLEGCVVPVMYSTDSTDDDTLFGEQSIDSCMLSAENGYLVAEESEFATSPAEVQL